MNYFKDSYEEMQKVTWPTQNRAIHTTIITIVFTIIATAFLTFVDFSFKKGYTYLTDISPKANSVDMPNTPEMPEVDLGGIQAVDSEGNPIDVPILPSN